ncbi:MAG: cupin domain-containing protein [Ardenticatenaceae bacterium]|nr:cupin domain-containing protein [Ardenticatenaceae bacterium]
MPTNGHTVRLNELKQFGPHQLTNLEVFDADAFHGRLLCFEPGQRVPLHSHEHLIEVFDVVEGTGTFHLQGKEIAASPGTTIFVPPNTIHGLSAGSERWVLRETVHERVYARRALKLLWLAVRKRLPGGERDR